MLRWKQSRNYVPTRKLCTKIMQEEYDVPMARQCGERTIRMVVGKRFYMPKMKQVVEHFVCICVKCQSTKSIYKKKYGLYKLLLIPSEPWESVSMDLMTQLPKWNWMDAIFMVVNRNGNQQQWTWGWIRIEKIQGLIRWNQGGGVCQKNGTSLNGKIKLLVHELAIHVLVG